MNNNDSWVVTSKLQHPKHPNTMKKQKVFCNWPCNSLYLYVVSANKQVAWIVELQFTIYIVQPIAIQLQLNQNNSFSTIIQLHYNCTHNVMLMSLIVINLLNFDAWHYEKNWTWKWFSFQNIDLHYSLWLLMVVRNCDTWHNKKFPHGILIILNNIKGVQVKAYLSSCYFSLFLFLSISKMIFKAWGNTPITF